MCQSILGKKPTNTNKGVPFQFGETSSGNYVKVITQPFIIFGYIQQWQQETLTMRKTNFILMMGDNFPLVSISIKVITRNYYFSLIKKRFAFTDISSKMEEFLWIVMMTKVSNTEFLLFF